MEPLLPAIFCFGPFFILLFLSVLLRRGQEPKKVPPKHIASAVVICLGIGIAGAIGSFLLF